MDESRETQGSEAQEPTLRPSDGLEASYEDLVAYFAAKKRFFKTTPKIQIPIENTKFLQICNKIYQISPKLFTENNYELLKQHSEFAEEILLNLRPNTIQAFFGNFQADDAVINSRIFILSVLYKNGILEYQNGKIYDQDWIKFLNSIDPAKLEQYHKVFVLIDKIRVDNIGFFTQVRAHNDLDSLYRDLNSNIKFRQAYGIGDSTLSEDTQIKGFTLINEHVCKRTRYFPRQWKLVMRQAWEAPSSEHSFTLYKLYAERQLWLAGLNSVIRAFLSYFYTRPIFAKFDTEPLTQVCNLLQSIGELNLDTYKLMEDMPETALAFCNLLNSKGKFQAAYLEKIKGVSEDILKNICEANKKQLITTSTLDLLLRLGKLDIDGTAWMIHKPHWLLISRLNDASLKLLGSIESNQQIFDKIKELYEANFIEIFEKLNVNQQKNVLTNPNYGKLLTLVKHLEALGLSTSENIQAIFDNASRLVEDNNLYQSIINMEKISPKRDQKRLDRLLESKDRKLYTSKESQPAVTNSTFKVIVSALPDEKIASHLAKKLGKMGIQISAEELRTYKIPELLAFNSALPLFQEDNLLNQNKIKYMLDLFKVPDPQGRCRCMIVLSQCGLLIPEKLYSHIRKLESVLEDNPALFQQIYAETWVQTDTTPKWLSNVIEAGIQEPDLNENAEETLINRFLIENEENAAYLALDDTKEKIATHANPPLLQQILKLVDKSKLRVDSSLDGLLQANAEELQKIYAWLFILNKANLLDYKNAAHILHLGHHLPGKVEALKNNVNALKANSDFRLDTFLTPKILEQLLSERTSAQTKQKTMEYINAVIQNPSNASRTQLAFMASDVAEIAGEKASAVKKTITHSAGVWATAASTMGQQVYGQLNSKIKMFTSKSKPTVAELLHIAAQNEHFKGSYYQNHSQQLTNDLNVLAEQELLSEENVNWLVQQPNQELNSRCLRLLANANMLRNNDQWQNTVNTLTTYETANLTELEKKCERLRSASSSKADKERAVQTWLEPILRSLGQSPHA